MHLSEINKRALLSVYTGKSELISRDNYATIQNHEVAFSIKSVLIL